MAELASSQRRRKMMTVGVLPVVERMLSKTVLLFGLTFSFFRNIGSNNRRKNYKSPVTFLRKTLAAISQADENKVQQLFVSCTSPHRNADSNVPSFPLL